MLANDKVKLERRGGARAGAGRKPVGRRAGVEHRPREPFARLAALHVTMRMAFGVYNLRSQRCAYAIEHAMRGGANRFGVRIIQFSIQGNHIHLLVEAPDASQLPRAIKGLGVRLAKAMNRVMRRQGPVIGDRYHSRRLDSSDAVRIVMNYIADNHRRHMSGRKRLPPDWVTPTG